MFHKNKTAPLLTTNRASIPLSRLWEKKYIIFAYVQGLKAPLL
jgi:hypothetical protein